MTHASERPSPNNATWKTDTPTPIDPADIRPGDVVERQEVFKVREVDAQIGFAVDEHNNSWCFSGARWHLVHRPDPDAEAVEALSSAASRAYIVPAGEAHLPIGEHILYKLREQGWDVTRRQNGQEHA